MTSIQTTPATPKGRRTRELVLRAARTVFGRDGFVATRMSDVAQQANLSMGGLYRYFRNKEELFAELIRDLHEELFESSRASRHNFGAQPFEALMEANYGYLDHYYRNRDVMRAFMEAAHVDERFRDIWWDMRNRHTERFVRALGEGHGIAEVDGVDATLAADAMACMVEQSAYVWYGQESLSGRSVPVEDAARVVSLAWYRTFFGGRAASR